nr:2123_t:CDS:2 [Entrophospora candida]
MTHISQPVMIEVPESFEKMDDIDHLMIMIADMLGCVIIHNDRIRLTPADLTRFHSRASPSISVIDYLRRIVKYTATEKACLLILLIYIDRHCATHIAPIHIMPRLVGYLHKS